MSNTEAQRPLLSKGAYPNAARVEASMVLQNITWPKKSRWPADVRMSVLGLNIWPCCIWQSVLPNELLNSVLGDLRFGDAIGGKDSTPSQNFIEPSLVIILQQKRRTIVMIPVSSNQGFLENQTIPQDLTPDTNSSLPALIKLLEKSNKASITDYFCKKVIPLLWLIFKSNYLLYFWVTF